MFQFAAHTAIYFQFTSPDAPFLSFHRFPRVASFLLTRGYSYITLSG